LLRYKIRERVFLINKIKLTGPSSLSFNLDNFPAIVGATGRANMMRQLRAMALGT
jgi:hypothetical protein